jgi:hypothetical protein
MFMIETFMEHLLWSAIGGEERLLRAEAGALARYLQSHSLLSRTAVSGEPGTQEEAAAA